MPEVFTNFATSTLAAGISAVATSLTVQSGDGNTLFPAPTGGDFFRAILFKKATGDVELIICTARSADTLTIVRAQGAIGNGTPTAIAFNAGDLVELRPTAEFYDSLSVTSAQVQSGEFLYAADSGVADAYVVTMTPTAVAIVAGQAVRVKINTGNTNTGIAATLKLDALAAKSILMDDGSNPPAGTIKAGFVHTFVYDGTNFVFQSIGLALTSTGYNALGKQIKNVAAGTAATDAATIGGAETLSGKTVVSAVLNTQVTGTGVKDEDDMVSDSAVHLATQQSIKAYVTSSVTAGAAFRGCLAYFASSQSIPNGHGSSLTVVFDTEVYDTDSIHDNVTNNTRFTVPSGVTKIEVTAAVTFQADATGYRATFLRVNGLAGFPGTHSINQNPINGATTRMQLSTAVLDVTAGDYIELIVSQDSGGSLLLSAGDNDTWLSFKILE